MLLSDRLDHQRQNAQLVEHLTRDSGGPHSSPESDPSLFFPSCYIWIFIIDIVSYMYFKSY